MDTLHFDQILKILLDNFGQIIFLQKVGTGAGLWRHALAKPKLGGKK